MTLTMTLTVTLTVTLTMTATVTLAVTVTLTMAMTLTVTMAMSVVSVYWFSLGAPKCMTLSVTKPVILTLTLSVNVTLTLSVNVTVTVSYVSWFSLAILAKGGPPVTQWPLCLHLVGFTKRLDRLCHNVPRSAVSYRLYILEPSVTMWTGLVHHLGAVKFDTGTVDTHKSASVDVHATPEDHCLT
jgi:hypothetical protein